MMENSIEVEQNFAVKEGMTRQQLIDMFVKGKSFTLNGKKVTVFSANEHELLYEGKVFVKRGKGFFRAKILYLQVL